MVAYRVSKVATAFAVAGALFVAIFTAIPAAAQGDVYFLVDVNLDFNNAVYAGDGAAAWHGCGTGNHIYQGASASRLTGYCDGVEFDSYTGDGTLSGSVWDIRITKRDDAPLDFGALFTETDVVGVYDSVELPLSGSVPEELRVCSDSLNAQTRIDLDCDLISTRVYDLNDFSMLGVTVRSGSVRIYYDAAYHVVYGQPPEPDAGGAMPFGATCAISYTQTITNDQGITSTQTISYTAPSNLMPNYSFEAGGGYHPDDWRPVLNGQESWTLIGYWATQNPRNGTRALTNNQAHELWGDPGLIPGGDFLAGFHARCDAITCTDSVSLSWDDTPIVTASGAAISSTYQVYSDSFAIGGGNPSMILAWNDAANLSIDDAFLYPIDTNGDLLCSADFYPPPDSSDDGTSPGPVGPIPIGAAGTTCYLCTSPPFATPDFVSHWIAWLGCVIRNMFSCSLRVWLLKIENVIMGLINMGYGWIAWVPSMLNAGVIWLQSWFVGGFAWVNSYILTAIGGIAVTQTPGTNLFDLLIALVELLGDLIGSLSSLFLGVVELLGSLLNVIPTAMASDPIAFEFADTGQTAPAAGELTASGGNRSKILWLVFGGLAFMDSAVLNIGIVHIIMTMAMGIASVAVILWVFSYWNLMDF